MTPVLTDRYLVGIDAGGTKIHFRAATLDGTTALDAVIPAGPWTRLPLRSKATRIVEQLRSMGLTGPDAIGIGAHGCDSDDECERLRSLIAESISAPLCVVNDALLLVPADRINTTAGLVIGTGSIAVARDPAGRSLYSGGWGWLIGDPGSAWGLVRDAVRALAQQQDQLGGTVKDPLLVPLLEVAGTSTLRDLSDALTNRPAQSWADWAPIIFDALRAGSQAADQAVQEGATALVGHVKDLTRRGAMIEQVICGGAVIIGQPIYQERIAQQFKAELEIRLSVTEREPVDGALDFAAALLPKRM
jgi:glucosamine kinase